MAAVDKVQQSLDLVEMANGETCDYGKFERGFLRQKRRPVKRAREKVRREGQVRARNRGHFHDYEDIDGGNSAAEAMFKSTSRTTSVPLKVAGKKEVGLRFRARMKDNLNLFENLWRARLSAARFHGQ